jgi:type II secretory pathway component PulJ
LKSACKINSHTLGIRGFTVAEIILALGIGSILFLAMISLFASINRSYATQNVAAGVQQVARVGIDIIAKNIRLAGLNPLQAANAGIITARPAQLRLTYDANGDGTIDSTEDITFWLNGNTLTRQTRDSSYPLVDNVSDLSFTYFDAADLQTITTNAIRTIEVSLTVAEPAGRDKSLSRTYCTRVVGRNLGFQ